jgi:phosphonate transport system substrate-binding protein
MKRIYPFVAFFILLPFLFGCEGKGDGVSGLNEKPIKIGFMICNSRSESKARFEPIAAYLSEKIGRKFEPVLVDTYQFEDYVRDKKLDFTHSNSMLAITYAKNYGLELLAVDKRGAQGHMDTGIIFARKDSGIKNFDDMRGKTMVFGPGPVLSYVNQRAGSGSGSVILCHTPRFVQARESNLFSVIRALRYGVGPPH